jgi:hypothetical protein
MLGLDASKFSLALLISVFRHIYLELAHDHVYTATNGYINGYVLVSLLLYLLKIPWYIILFALTSRVVYRKSLGDEVVNTSNHPYNVFAFFVMVFIATSLVPSRGRS